MSFTDRVRNLFRRATQRIRRIVGIAVNNIRNVIKNLWRNAESVAILTIGSLGASHFIGSYVFANPSLNTLIFAEMIGPVAAVGIIWGLLKSSELRRNARRARSSAMA